MYAAFEQVKLFVSASTDRQIEQICKSLKCGGGGLPNDEVNLPKRCLCIDSGFLM